MRILFVNQYFPPDASATAYLLGELAEDLARRHEVWVVAGRPSYNPKSSRFRPREVLVRRAWSTEFPRAKMAGRLANYATYLIGSAASALCVPRPDIVVSLTDPPAVGAVGLIVARRYRVPFVYVCEDIFPDVAVALGVLRNRAAIQAWRQLNRHLRAEAARVVAISRDMRAKLEGEGVPPEKVVVIPNWGQAHTSSPADVLAARRHNGWDGRFVVMHAGNLGLAQNPGIIVGAAGVLQEAWPEVLVVFLGDGASRAKLERRVQNAHLSNVRFLSYLPKDEAQLLMGAADLHVVSLMPGLWGCVAPSKVYGIMAAGKPYVAAVEPGSEPALLAEEHGCGLVVQPDDADALARAILDAREAPLEEMGRRGRGACERLYDRPIATDRYRRLLEEVAAQP
jgi:colanic acid biosynthesis glycosyl transferase WcaI